MSEKVKLPKEVCDALDNAMTLSRNFDYTIAEMTRHGKWENKELQILNSQNVDVIMRALVLGYEPELSAEEQLKEKYFTDYEFGYMEQIEIYRHGVKDALKTHGIHYDWIRDVE